jgi:hypothetical protein
VEVEVEVVGVTEGVVEGEPPAAPELPEGAREVEEEALREGLAVSEAEGEPRALRVAVRLGLPVPLPATLALPRLPEGVRLALVVVEALPSKRGVAVTLALSAAGEAVGARGVEVAMEDSVEVSVRLVEAVAARCEEGVGEVVPTRPLAVAGALALPPGCVRGREGEGV